MKTRDKILQQARLLFNEKGLSLVSLRQIAKQLGMSDGNLRYHFKTKDELLQALYMELVGHFDQQIDSLSEEQALSMGHLFSSVQWTYRRLFAYRFFMLDFVNLCRQHPEIGGHFKQLQVMRRQQFLGLTERFVSQGIMRPAAYLEEYQHLHDRMQVLSDFWLSSAEIVGVPAGTDPILHYSKINLSMIYPYLNPTAQAEMQAWLAS
ncbi:MAG: TetR/AcrR family transcriptional regulator [Bacteroidota bacterium]